MHAGTAEPYRVTPPEAVVYLIELPQTSSVELPKLKRTVPEPLLHCHNSVKRIT